MKAPPEPQNEPAGAAHRSCVLPMDTAADAETFGATVDAAGMLEREAAWELTAEESALALADITMDIEGSCVP